MYAIVQIGGAQYKVSEGDMIDADRIKEDEGKDITIEKVLMLSDGKKVRIGQPYLEDVKVTAKVVKQTTGIKVKTMKYRLRKDSSTRSGHREKLTSLNILKIAA